MKRKNFNFEKPKNYIIADPRKISEDIDLRFVVINMFNKTPITLPEATPERLKEISKKYNLIFLPDAKKEDLAVLSGTFSSREEARMSGCVGEIPAGFQTVGRGSSKYTVFKPVR